MFQRVENFPFQVCYKSPVTGRFRKYGYLDFFDAYEAKIRLLVEFPDLEVDIYALEEMQKK